MRNLALKSAVVAVSILALSGCATKAELQDLRAKHNADVDALRSDVAKAQKTANDAMALAQKASQDAADAAAQAKAASERADRIFRESLRK
jgi:hypothetical protein